MPTANEDLADGTVAKRLRLLRYEAGAVEELLRLYEEAVAEPMAALLAIQRRLDREPDTFTPIDAAQVARLRERLTEDVRAAQAAMRAEMSERLTEAVSYEVDASTGLLRAAVPGLEGVRDVAIGDALTAIMDPIGGLRWTSRLAVDLLEVHDELQAVLGLAALSGQSVPSIARRIRAATGLVETYKGRFVAIARTEIQRVSNDAAMRVYMENGHILQGVQYLATLDSRTCLVCAPDHNRVFRFVGDRPPAGMPQIPRHPRCRCFYAPVTKSWSELGVPVTDAKERRRLDGSLAENMSFDAWLRRQGPAFQRKMLGSDAAFDAFQAGVPLERFSDAGRPLRVGELRALVA